MVDLTVKERAELVADEFGIDPETFSGREGDAVFALGLLKAAVRGYTADMTNVPQRYAIDDALRKIYVDMNFQTTHPGFCDEIHAAVADIIANPAWRPGSMTNKRLLGELKFWRNVDAVVTKLGYPTLGGAMASMSKNFGKGAKDALSKPSASVWGATKSGLKALKPDITSGILVIGTGVRTVASRSVDDLELEAKRRNLLGELDERDKLNAGIQ